LCDYVRKASEELLSAVGTVYSASFGRSSQDSRAPLTTHDSENGLNDAYSPVSAAARTHWLGVLATFHSSSGGFFYFIIGIMHCVKLVYYPATALSEVKFLVDIVEVESRDTLATAIIGTDRYSSAIKTW